jgi:hypothetical protein
MLHNWTRGGLEFFLWGLNFLFFFYFILFFANKTSTKGIKRKQRACIDVDSIIFYPFMLARFCAKPVSGPYIPWIFLLT